MSRGSYRRQVLALIGCGSAAMLAGCSSGSDDETTASGGDDGDDGDDSGGGDGDIGESTTDVPDDLTAADVLAEDGVSGFVAEFEVGDEHPMTGTQIVYGEDFYLDEEVSGVERYAVGNSIYIVHQGGCDVEHRGDPTGMDDAYVPAEPARGYPLEDVPVSHATTVDGEEAYVIELDEITTMYVSTETGYRVREEFGPSGVADFHSWGETDPIEPPEEDCGG